MSFDVARRRRRKMHGLVLWGFSHRITMMFHTRTFFVHIFFMYKNFGILENYVQKRIFVLIMYKKTYVNNPKAAMILANNFGVQTAIPLGETDVATSFFRTKFWIVPLQRRFCNFVKLQNIPKICAKILYPLGTLKIPRMVNVLFLVIFRHRKWKVPIPASVSTSARWVDVQKTKVPNG